MSPLSTGPLRESGTDAERLAAAAGKYGGKGLQVASSRITGDVRPGRENEKWLNVILRKIGV